MSAAIPGVSSESGEIGAYSTHTPPQPPSALIARNAACARGLTEPNPDACGTWQKRLGSVFGPMLTGSNTTACLASMGAPPWPGDGAGVLREHAARAAARRCGQHAA